METPKERNKFFTASRVHRELQSTLDSFSAAVSEVRARRSLHRNDLIELLRQLRHRRVVVIGAAHVNKLRGLILNRADDFRLTMTGRAHRDPGVAVEKDVAIDVRDPDAFAAFGDKFEIWARVSRVNELRVSFDYRA